MKPKTIKVLLYYKYVKLKDPNEVEKSQRELCTRLNLGGRILLSTEGINGTVAGLVKDVDEYIKQTEKIEAFSNMEWKVSWSDEQIFPKLRIRVRDEIVTLGLRKGGDDVEISSKADYIEPEELFSLYENSQDFVIIDARNNYEARVGKFKGAITAPIDNFKDFPKFANGLEKFKDKEVVTYCTGGVRCEKASAYLRQKGFKKVRQLHGGIHEYAKRTSGKYFEGEMFVFDKRMLIPVNSVNPTVISECKYCQKPISRYVDCSYPTCHSLFVCCQECQQLYQSACSENCIKQLQIQTNN
ncbi:MAG TPA: rhodanese-related sulfurtransferase [Candidatus Saccharimonadales bacterium]|nr:rhodanese-related sulfurtransferase [Candidatus Saccharimonadales bacterium]